MQETRVWFLGREDSPREGNDNPLQYSCLENPMDRGAWWATFHGVTTVAYDLLTKPPSECGYECESKRQVKFDSEILYGATERIKLPFCCCSVTQSRTTICDPMDGSTPGFSVLHYLLWHPLHFLPSLFPSIKVFSKLPFTEVEILRNNEAIKSLVLHILNLTCYCLLLGTGAAAV